MASRRQRIQAFYSLSRELHSLLLEKTAASADRYRYRGEARRVAAIVRTDLNGYSAWAGRVSLRDRVNLLDEFFCHVVGQLEATGGVYFRDEGDCIVAMFSPYFGSDPPVVNILSFCEAAARAQYGVDELTAKVSVAVGNVAFYQKAHEVEQGDWSAEGDPFVRAARLEAAVESRRSVYFFADEYNRDFVSSESIAVSEEEYFWISDQNPVQVPGLRAKGGWIDVVELRYVPGGRVQP